MGHRIQGGRFESLTGSEWLVVPVGAIWLSVLLTSLFAPDLVVGAAATHYNIVALVNWLWGGVASALVLRATLFAPRGSIDWAESAAPIWIGAAVVGIWLAVTVISLGGPEVVYDTWRVPASAIVSPAVGVVVTTYATRFLVGGFAAIEESAA